ncbi:MAG: class I SAM-dependent methyltransferase [Candidatus Woesearchaeota archaeon]|nr:MAG: class I SAM-dependent methyltransferase [Candidatus Woesearchaeota archaeon]
MKIRKYRRKELLGIIPNLKNKTLLDIGASNCYSFNWAYNRLAKNNGKNIILVDINYGKEINKYIFSENAICADAKDLPFKNNNFDIVTSGWLLDYFKGKELEKVVNESSRVIKPKGYFIGDVPVHPEKTEEDIILFTRKFQPQIEEYRKLMQNNNLKILQDGLGFENYEIVNHLVYYFVAQKA